MSSLPVWTAVRRMPFLSVRTAMRCVPSPVGSAAYALFHVCVEGSTAYVPPFLRRRQCGAAQWKGKKRMKTVYRVSGTMGVEENDGLAVQSFRRRRLRGAGCTVKWLGSMAMCTVR